MNLLRTPIPTHLRYFNIFSHHTIQHVAFFAWKSVRKVSNILRATFCSTGISCYFVCWILNTHNRDVNRRNKSRPRIGKGDWISRLILAFNAAFILSHVGLIHFWTFAEMSTCWNVHLLFQQGHTSLDISTTTDDITIHQLLKDTAGGWD